MFALLVLACFAAFFITQRLKHTPTVLQSPELTPRFSPTAAGPAREERISFKLAHADAVTVTILDGAGNTVATLVRDWRVARYKQFSLRWNGRRGEPRGYTIVRVPSRRAPGGVASVLPLNRGPLAGAGEYRVRVSLRRQHRTINYPRTFTLER
ncbi:MAG TPA: hypothetical protein VMG62_00555 [Solirubrobacteraceae bacterium]|nr:hypothetical protein [Solirubrobacteraceae bacterium]